MKYFTLISGGIVRLTGCTVKSLREGLKRVDVKSKFETLPETTTAKKGCRFVPWTFVGNNPPQMVPVDLNIGFHQGSAAWFRAQPLQPCISMFSWLIYKSNRSITSDDQIINNKNHHQQSWKWETRWELGLFLGVKFGADFLGANLAVSFKGWVIEKDGSSQRGVWILRMSCWYLWNGLSMTPI